MYHSVTFGDKNTWDDWCLIPNGRPVFAPPTQKTNFVDIPGGDGSLDLSEALTGYPVYNNREGTMSFIIMNKGASHFPECNPMNLDNTYSEVMRYLHGKVLTAILEDDPYYKYEGRFSVEGISPGADWTTIEIGYNVKPYKHSLDSSTVNNWLWDTFNFETGVISKSVFADIPVNTTQKTVEISRYYLGDEPVCPNFIVNASQGVYVRALSPSIGVDVTKKLQNGITKDPDIVLYGDNVSLILYTASGSGTVSVDFYQGRL